LLNWFTEYFKRFPELHILSPRISNVVEAIDERVKYDLSRYHVRDHIFLLLMQTLMAYNSQRTWGKDWFEGPQRGDDDQIGVGRGIAQIHEYTVQNHAFEVKKDGDEVSGAVQQEKEEGGPSHHKDLLQELFLAFFDQKEWATDDWGVTEELQNVIKLILSLGLCNSEEIALAQECLKNLGAGLQEDFLGEDESEAGDGVEQEEDEKSVVPIAGRRKIGMHRTFIGENDDAYAKTYLRLKDEQWEGRIPDIRKLPPKDDEHKQMELMQDFLNETLQLPDIDLQEQLRVDVNLWRRQQLVHETFMLVGSAQRQWNVKRDLRKTLSNVGLEVFNEEHVLQEFQCEIHLHHDMHATDFAAHLIGMGADGVENQIYFEVEVNGEDVIYLENLTNTITRRKVALHMFGAHSIVLRSRCLRDTKKMQLTVANPRVMVLTSPKAFDPEVVSRFVTVAGRKHAAAIQGLLNSTDLHERQLDDKVGSVSATKKVIHELMPKFSEKIIDLLEAKVFDFKRQSKGLDIELLQQTREHEHKEVVAMLSRSVSFVTMDAMLDKLDLENNKNMNDLLQAQYPYLVDVFDAIKEDSIDDDEWNEIPKLLKDEQGELFAENVRMARVQEWVLLLCHAIRTVSFLGTKKLDIAVGFTEQKSVAEQDFDQLFYDYSAEKTSWSVCVSLLNILQELLAPDEEIEFLWAKDLAPSNQCVATNPATGKLNVTFVNEKATLFCPFSCQQAGAVVRNHQRLMRFFDEAQVPEIDPLMLVSVLLYHPAASIRLEAFRLGVRILGDPNDYLQTAYRNHTRNDMHLQKAMGYQFSSFQSCYKKAKYSNNDVDVMDEMLKLIQQLCEGHNSNLQEFLGEDYMAEELDIFSAKITDEEEEQKEEEDDEGGAKGVAGEPSNISQWISSMIHLIVSNMTEAQQWQASMNGREKQYVLICQLFDTASELVQGPSLSNQKLLLEAFVCVDINLLWKIVRIDEFAFRGLIQDNEDLADSWMELLQAMRFAELAALRFLLSLMEEEELDQDDPDYADKQTEVINHKTMTIKHMIEELNPKALADKIITHWNLSSEVDDPTFEVEPVQDPDEIIQFDTADRITRPKREIECEFYLEDDQKDHCLQICVFAYSVFSAIFNAPEMRTPLFKEIIIDKSDYDPRLKPEFFQSSNWSTQKTKVFEKFVSKVEKDHGSKYLHFLIGQIEIVRGSRLQRIFFLMPRSIRTLKNNSLVHGWQENCLQEDIDRDSPEALIDSFSDAIMQRYISFVNHQYSLLSKPPPLNQAGEVIEMCIQVTMATTCVINSIMIYVYVGSYSEHSVMNTALHYPSKFSVYVIQFFCGIHFLFSLVWITFHIISFSGWIIETGIDDWKLGHPRESYKVQYPAFRFYLASSLFLSDRKLQYNGLLLVCSALGVYFNFLCNAVNTIDLCMNVGILAKVIESIMLSLDQVFGTMILGYFLQYVFVAISFMIFGQGYGFADKDTSGCSTLMECLRAHFDYGFRSAPVWGDADLDLSRFLFDYLYNLLVILIMAAIISGIIIDTFSELKEKQQEINEAMQSSCFICSLTRSELERQRVKYEKHILQDHYMWSYARFLLYLSDTSPSNLSGPESYVKQKIKENNMGFFPIQRCIAFESSEMGEEHLEREVRVKDMDELKGNLTVITKNTTEIRKSGGGFKLEIKELREALQAAIARVQGLQQLLQADDDQDKKKKKKKGG